MEILSEANLAELLTLHKVVDKHGNIAYYNPYGELHRIHGPAFIYVDGGKCWYKNGYFHRTDGPAVIYATGNRYWYQNGLIHRIDGPAIEYSNGNKEWYENGIHVGSEPSRDSYTS